MKIVTARGIITGIIVFDFLNCYPEAVSQISDWLTEGVMETKEDIYEGIKQFPSVLLKLFSGRISVNCSLKFSGPHRVLGFSYNYLQWISN